MFSSSNEMVMRIWSKNVMINKQDAPEAITSSQLLVKNSLLAHLVEQL